MYRESYQRGLLTIFFSCGSKPLNIWDTYTQNGYITKFLDEDIKSTVLEIGGTNVSTTYMICPKGKMVLGITMPFLVMIVKNLKKYFSFEVTILDDTETRRRFRVSNFQSSTQILPLCTVMPIALSEGWNQIQFNMSDFCRRAYKKQFVEVQKLKINANIRVRRIYFADKILPEDQLPAEYKLFIPFKQKAGAKFKPKTDEEGLAPQKEKSAEMEKRDSKSDLASKVTKDGSVVKTVSQVQAFEKRSSKVVEGAEVEGSFKPSSEALVATAEGGSDQSEVAIEVPVVPAEVPVAPAEDPGAMAERSPDQSTTAVKAPATEASVTEALATEASVTEAPATEASVTEAPATEASITEAPATEASVTEAPATEVPTTESPETEAPATEAPGTDAPATEALVATDEIPRAEEAATETTELVKEISV